MREGHSEVTKVLLEAGADPEEADKDGNTPLMLAAATYARSHGYQQIVELLESAKAPLQQEVLQGKNNPDITFSLLEGKSEFQQK